MIQDDLIAALKNKDFDAIPSIARQFGAQTLLELQAAPTAEARAKIYQDSAGIIHDALYLARVLKAHIGTQLQTNSVSLCYANADLEQHRWQIKA